MKAEQITTFHGTQRTFASTEGGDKDNSVALLTNDDRSGNILRLSRLIQEGELTPEGDLKASPVRVLIEDERVLAIELLMGNLGVRELYELLKDRFEPKKSKPIFIKPSDLKDSLSGVIHLP